MKKQLVNTVKSILSMHILTPSHIIELEYRSGDLPGGAYGTKDCTESLTLDQLKAVRDFIDQKLKERVK